MTQHKITIQETNNPAIIKFSSNEFITKNSFEYKNIDEASDAPLAQQLFYLPFVKTVYISGNFVAIERYNIVEWSDVSQEVSEQIEAYLNSGEPVVNNDEEKKQAPITVYAESTPNPAVMKFVSNKKLVTKIWEFKNIDEATYSPIAKSLFHFPFVKEVFIDENYISISKYEMADWGEITMELREFIRAYLADDKTIIEENAPVNQEKQAPSEVEFESLDTTSQQIVNIIEEYIKPAVASDGGNILFKDYNEDTQQVSVILQGACSGCPSSTFTLKNGIETMLRDMLNNPQLRVEAING